MSADPAEDFSPEGYAALLQCAVESGYQFVTFSMAEMAAKSPGRHCLLRHDVDVSLAYALAMAEVEAERGIASTYFVMLRSGAYNLLSRAGSGLLREIVALGHEIGVHFDAGHSLVSDDRLVDLVREEARIVGDVASSEIHAVSFHQPSQQILDGQIVVPGLINSYNRAQLERWHYVSDSNRRWRAESAARLLREATHDKIQLLVHPIWWMARAGSSEKDWRQALIGNFRATLQFFHDTEDGFGPMRSLDWSGDGGG